MHDKEACEDMGARAGHEIGFLSRLFILLLLCVIPAVLTATTPQHVNPVARSQPGKVILWDEGPAAAARPVFAGSEREK